jgi:hypothetical protein
LSVKRAVRLLQGGLGNWKGPVSLTLKLGRDCDRQIGKISMFEQSGSTIIHTVGTLEFSVDLRCQKKIGVVYL